MRGRRQTRGAASERAPFLENHPLYSGGLPFAIGPLMGHDVALVIGAPV
jgi:benzoylformate decarboxylase